MCSSPTYVLQLDPAACSAEQRTAALAEAGKLRSWIDSRVAAFMAAIAAESTDPLAAADALSKATGASNRAAKGAARFAKDLNELDETATALAAGEINTEHAEKIAKVHRRSRDGRKSQLHQAETALVEAAKTQSPEEFERTLTRWERRTSADEGVTDEQRRRQNRKVSLFEGDDKMVVINGQLDPESGQVIRAALDRLVGEMWRAENRKSEEAHIPDNVSKSGIRHADALVEMARRSMGVTAEQARRVAQPAAVLVDYDTMVHGIHEHSTCELGDGTPVSPATARRIACSGGVIPVVLNSAGVPLDVGRARRLATPAQRIALRTVHQACAVKGCDLPFAWCEIHHIVPFEHGGPTDLNNLVPLCSRHHHLIHEGGWILTRDQLNPIRVTFTRADDGEPAREPRHRERTRRRTAQPALL